MSSKYQMWLTFNGEKEKIQFPVHPEEIEVSVGGNIETIDLPKFGEMVILQGKQAEEISFSSIFPAVPFQGVQVNTLTQPETLKSTIKRWKDSGKPVHFLITGTAINLFCAIEDFACNEKGGDVGTLYYDLSLKEYRNVSVRQLKVNPKTKTASVPAKTTPRTDNRVRPKTYTVKKGDCLWNIAKKYLGNGNRYKEIFELNRDKIKNPNLIYPGQVLKLPTS